MARATAALLLSLAVLTACVSLQSRRTVHVRAFEDVEPDGSYRYLELSDLDGRRAAEWVVVSDAGAVRSPIEPDRAPSFWAALEDAGAREGPVFPLPDTVSALIERIPFADGARIPFQLDAVAPVELRLSNGPAAQGGAAAIVSVGLPGSTFEAEAGHVMLGAHAWLGSVLLLPDHQQGLLLAGSAAVEGGQLYRLDDLEPLDLAGAASLALQAQALAQLNAQADHDAELTLERALALTPRDAVAHYNLACALSRQGQPINATVELRAAFELDRRKLRRLARTDPDLSALHGLPEFEALVSGAPDAG